MNRKILAAMMIGGTMVSPAHALAITPTITASYKVDILSTVDGGRDHKPVALDNLEIIADLEATPPAWLDHLTTRVHVLNNLGRAPNDHADTLQGIDNIEVAHHRAKLYQAWADIGFLGDRASLRAGLYDLNSEFYQTPASGLLISPAFGIGSELAATGPNGPSIFPSTALAARFRLQNGKTYVQGAILNAMAGTIGDDQGVALSGRDGALGVAEAGWEGPSSKFAIGLWTYSKAQPRIVAPGLSSDGRRARSRGFYLLGQARLAGDAQGRSLTAFVRAGVSDGKTTPFRGGAQTGLLIEGVRGGSPASALTLGINSGFLSRHYRLRGSALARSETGLEISYRDRLHGPVMVQPDLQYIINAGGGRHRNVVVAGIRFQVDCDLLSSR